MVDGSISVVKTGAVIAFTGTTANVAIPTDNSGNIPRYVRLAATNPCFVKIGTTGVTAVSGDLMIQPADSAIVRTYGMTFIAALQVSAAGTLQISPIEES